MHRERKIGSALVSVYHKDGLEPWIRELAARNVTIYSTGGTRQFIESLGIAAIDVENITGYPSVLGGRVKTLHPGVFGGILYRRGYTPDEAEIEKYHLPPIDLVMVDLYPFEATLAQTDDADEIIEKIDIGGISLIRAAAKNFNDVAIIPSVDDYATALTWFREQEGCFTATQRAYLAARAFAVSSHYDAAIYGYFAHRAGLQGLRYSSDTPVTLRYGENPHQKGFFYGDTRLYFEQLHGKEISYNNLLDIDAALALIARFGEPTVAVIKHNNACGIASRPLLKQAWEDALAGDPVSAYGGIVVANRPIDEETAMAINTLFFEVLLAPGFEKNSLELLRSRKNRIILQTSGRPLPARTLRTVLDGMLLQERDTYTELPETLKPVTNVVPTPAQTEDLLFAMKVAGHLKSNAIALVRNKQLLGGGAGQTSRVDALRHAIEKARASGFSLDGAVMASDAFFPFADSIELAHEAGIQAVIQPGGSVRDQDSVDFCNARGIAMVFTGIRHFKH